MSDTRALESKVQLQQNRFELLKLASDPITKLSVAELTKIKIQSRLDHLEKTWERIEREHEAIYTLKFEVIKDHEYIATNVFSNMYETYDQQKVYLLEKLAEVNAANPHDGSVLADTSLVPAASSTRARLPELVLPTFDGNFRNWRSFSDMYTSLVGSSTVLDNVTKLQYLKRSLSGEAERLLATFAITADNFVPAWNKLVARYENKRVLIETQLEALFTLKKLTQPSAKGLQGLLSTIAEASSALKALGAPVESWDLMIVHLLTRCLDSTTRQAWALDQGAASIPADLSTVTKFIEARAAALETMDRHDTVKPQTTLKAKSHTTTSKPTPAAPSSRCPLCSESHKLIQCPTFERKSLSERKDFVKTKHLCFNCLGPHNLKDCSSRGTCRKCKQRHNTLLHTASPKSNKSTVNHVTADVEEAQSSDLQNSDSQSIESDEPAVINHATAGACKRSNVLLATALVEIHVDHVRHVVRALIDPGSELSFVSERIVQLLRLKRSSAAVSLLGVGASHVSTTRGVVSVNLNSLATKRYACTVTAFILPKLTALLPSSETKSKVWAHIQGLQLADPTFNTPGKIDMILGADVYSEILQDGIRKGPLNTPMAQATVFGWVLSGSVADNRSVSSARIHHCSHDDEVNQLIRHFWHQEEVPTLTCKLTQEEKACEDHFLQTHTRTEKGQYVVRIPLKEPASALGDSRSNAVRILFSLKRRLNANADYARMYTEFLNDYENSLHMSQVPDNYLPKSNIYYLPHHGVLRPSSTTTKLRVVFNGSARTMSGKSLNDIVHTGEKLQTELIDVLHYFRRYKYVVSADVKQMYRRVLVHQDDWDLQRILWLVNGKLVEYHLRTVTYGQACAPFLALRAFKQLVIDEGHRFPLAVPMLSVGRYVDDEFGGADTIEECVELVNQVIQICKAGQFHLQKWSTNQPKILAHLDPNLLATESNINFDSTSIIRTLGLSWNPESDSFHFYNHFDPVKNITKRKALSRIAQLFDPLGFVSPIIVTAKIFMQTIWLQKLDWDHPLPEALQKTWQAFESNLQDLHIFKIPRHLGLTKTAKVEIHGFSDASLAAMSAVVYLKVIHDDNVTVSFVQAKTKLTPTSRVSIPRLELNAAVLLTRLTHHVLQTLNLPSAPIWLWTDSSVTLTWLTNHPSKWKDFVANRVSFVQEKLPIATWRFVPGKENPADCASRGMTPHQLQAHQLWWQGPQWLKLDSAFWPKIRLTQSPQAETEARKVKSKSTLLTTANDSESALLNNYSDLTKLLRVTSWCFRFANRARRIPLVDDKKWLSVAEMQDSFLFWIKFVQKTAFKEELKMLAGNKQTIPKTINAIRNLNPFTDSDGFLRVGGRLDNSTIPYDAKHPYILPRNSTLSKLIIRDTHHRTMHGGTSSTLALLRQRFWILGGRAAVRQSILRCVTCARFRAERQRQLMGQLPSSRVTSARLFQHAGVDYAGPFTLKERRGRTRTTYKAYVALFICSATSYIHLELVTDYTAEAFIAAYKRFAGIYGVCKTLTSDQGTNFVGADKELQQLFSTASTQVSRLAHLLAKDGTQWHFNPPSAPNFGGHWEAGVKSMKHHLKRVMKSYLFTFEEFTTTLRQIQAVLNSRPICRLTDDPDDMNYLTPGHFFVGGPITSLPEPSLTHVPQSRLSLWQLTRRLTEQFWEKWQTEYLQQLQARYKWQLPQTSIQVGSIVFIIDERYPPSKWPLGKVIKLHPGRDGLTRVVTIKTATNTIDRPINKLCLLPTSGSLEEHQLDTHHQEKTST